MKKLQILSVTNTYPTTDHPGDTPQIKDQIEALKARGVDINLLYVNRYNGVQSYIKAAWQIMMLSFQTHRYNLVHAYYGHCGLLARLQAKYPIIVTFLGSDLLHPRDALIGKTAARFANGIIVQTSEMKKITKREDARVIPFGINPAFFQSYPMDETRHELGFTMDQKLVLFPWDPARKIKRFDLVQEAIQMVQKCYDQVHLVSIFDKSHETVAKYMSVCDVMVLASEHEGSPMALRESMACNLPIVAVDVGDVSQIIGNIEGCYLCKREAKDIAEKLNIVLDRGGRTRGADVVQQLDANWGADQAIKLYHHVLDSR